MGPADLAAPSAKRKTRVTEMGEGEEKKRGGWGTARKGAGERNRDKVEPSIVERPSRRMEARVVLRLLAGSGTRLSASEKSILFPISGS